MTEKPEPKPETRDRVRLERVVRLERHIEEAMKLMRDSGADEREYVVYAVLAASLDSDLLMETEEARRRLNEAIDGNFGVVGDDPTANMRLTKCREFESRLMVEHPDEWASYSDKHY